MVELFSCNYSQARERFCAEAKKSVFLLNKFVLPDITGPEEEALRVDVATRQAASPRSILFMVSGLHGVEGYCGSACQLGFLQHQLFDAFPADCTIVLIHAANPFGFAWNRRVNEEYVDVNRNFCPVDASRPDSTAYEELHPYLVPEDWFGAERQRADDALRAYIGTKEMLAIQAAVQPGQFSRPDGLFYGGSRETWSNKVLHRIVSEHVSQSVETIVVIDFHTGLGPTGYGEPICMIPGDDAFQRATRMFGQDVTSPFGLSALSSSAAVRGSLAELFATASCNANVIAIALEFGTIEILNVLNVLRADAWL